MAYTPSAIRSVFFVILILISVCCFIFTTSHYVNIAFLAVTVLTCACAIFHEFAKGAIKNQKQALLGASSTCLILAIVSFVYILYEIIFAPEPSFTSRILPIMIKFCNCIALILFGYEAWKSYTEARRQEEEENTSFHDVTIDLR